MCLFSQQGNWVFPDLLAAAAPTLGQYLPGPSTNTNVNFEISDWFLKVRILYSVKKVTGWSKLCLEFRSSMKNNYQKELRHIRIIKFEVPTSWFQETSFGSQQSSSSTPSQFLGNKLIFHSLQNQIPPLDKLKEASCETTSVSIQQVLRHQRMDTYYYAVK